MSKHIHSTTVTVDVDVDIDTDDLSDEDLIDICQERGIAVEGLNDEVIEELFLAFKQGREDVVIQRTRKLVQDVKGVVL